MKKLGLGLISLVAASAMLVACGGGGGDSAPLAASSNTTAPITAKSVGAVAGESFSFATGVTALGTSSPTTVTVNSASTFSVASSEGTASGNLSFGSCIFTVTDSTFAAGSKLAVGARVEVSPCELKIPTAGVSVDAAAAAKAVTFVVGTSTSAAVQLTVDVTPSGDVIVDGVVVGTVTVTPATGGSGS